MKKISLVLITLLFSFPAFSKVAIVDVQKVLTNVKEGKRVMGQLKSKFEQKQKLLKKDEATIKKLQESLAKQSAVLSDKAKIKKQREMQEKMVKYQQKTMGYQKEIQQMEQKLKIPMINKIQGVVGEVSKKEGFEMTFERGTAPIFMKVSTDITSKVIQAYNKKHK